MNDETRELIFVIVILVSGILGVINLAHWIVS
jgi:hypothetical protein